MRSNAQVDVVIALSVAVMSVTSGCSLVPPDAASPPAPQPQALFDVRGRATASAALQASEQPVEVPADLKAYLMWATAPQQYTSIDEVLVGGALPADFALEILDEPSTENEMQEYPGVAGAQLLVTTDDVVAALLAQDTASVADGSLYGIATSFVVFIRDEAAADLLETEARLRLDVGFSLIGPNPAAQACYDTAYDAVNRCYEAADARCGNGLDDEASDACYEAACSAAESAADERIQECPANVLVLPRDAELNVELQQMFQSIEDDVAPTEE